MNKAELVKAVAAHSGIEMKGVTENVIESLGTIVQQALANGEEVTLPGLGKISVTERAARTGRNPQTGEEIQIAARRAPKFSASKALKDAVA